MLFKAAENLLVCLALLGDIRQLVSARAEHGRRCLPQQLHIFICLDYQFQVNELIVDDTLDAVDRAENSIYLRSLESLFVNADKRCVYSAGRSARLCNSYVHQKFSLCLYCCES